MSVPRTLLPLTVLAAAFSIASLDAAAGKAPLAEALKAGDRTAALSLIAQRADVNAAEPDGTTALHWAARYDDLELAARLIDAGANVSAANRYGVTPLYLASANGSAAMIRRLLEAGADANATVNDGETALMTAARTGSVEAIRVLLDDGANVDAREAWHGQTALMWAAAQDHAPAVRELILRGASVDAVSAVKTWERQVTKEPRQKWLPPGGFTPLHFAAREGALAAAKALVEAGADIDAVDPDGISPLLMAIINGHYDVARTLIDEGADHSLADTTGRTPLYAAVDFNTMPASNRPAPAVVENEATSFELIEALLAHGADPNVQLERQAPYRTKLDRGNDTVLTTGTTPLLRAAKAGDVPAIRVLLAHGANAALATRNGVNALMIAAGLGTKEEDTTGRDKTEAETIETIRLMLEAGLDVNAVDDRGQTAVHGAALQGYDQVVRFLAERGAALDVKDKRGFTPLDVAQGLAGGVGFAGQASNPHPSTAALIEELLASRR
jgi:ankyrin repeat protein